MSLFCYQGTDCPLSDICYCKAVLPVKRKKELSRAKGCFLGQRHARQWASSGSQALSEGPALACRNPPPPTPLLCTGIHAAGSQHQSQLWGCRCFWTHGDSTPGISVPSRESLCGLRPHPSIGCSVGIPQLRPHTSFGNAIMPSTRLSPPDLSSVEWSRRR